MVVALSLLEVALSQLTHVIAMHEPWFYALWTLGAYLLGSLSMGDLVTRTARVNIRTMGTGNPGAANIYREVGPPYGIAVFVLDIAKGAAATVPLYLLGLPTWAGLLAMAALLAGQFFPVFWSFHGGTGMAAGMGTLAGLLPLGFLIATPITLLAVRLSRNAAYSGGLFFLVTLLAGGLLHRDGVGVIAVVLGGAAIIIRAWFQYRRR